MPGVYINAKAVTEPGKPVTLSTSVDTSKFTDLVRQMVASYNEVQSTITNEIKYDPDVKKRGGLANDFVSKSLLNQMRNLTTQSIISPTGSSVSLAQVERHVVLQFTGSCGPYDATHYWCRGKAPTEVITTVVSTDQGATSQVDQKLGTHALYMVEGVRGSDGVSYAVSGNVTFGTHLSRLNAIFFQSESGTISPAGSIFIAGDMGIVTDGTGVFQGTSGRYSATGKYDHTGIAAENAWWFSFSINMASDAATPKLRK